MYLNPWCISHSYNTSIFRLGRGSSLQNPGSEAQAHGSSIMEKGKEERIQSEALAIRCFYTKKTGKHFSPSYVIGQSKSMDAFKYKYMGTYNPGKSRKKGQVDTSAVVTAYWSFFFSLVLYSTTGLESITLKLHITVLECKKKKIK